MFECKICGYTVTGRAAVIKHLRRKKPCSSTTTLDREVLIQEILDSKSKETFQCKHCGVSTIFSRSSLYRHQASCKKNTLENRIEFLIKKIEKLEARAPQVNNTINTTNNNVNIVFNNIQDFIQLSEQSRNTFMNHLPLEYFDKTLKEKNTEDAICTILKDVFFNPEKKENMSFAVPKVNPPKILLHNSISWEDGDIFDIELLLSNMLEYVRSLKASMHPDIWNTMISTSFHNKVIKTAFQEHAKVESVHGYSIK